MHRCGFNYVIHLVRSHVAGSELSRQPGAGGPSRTAKPSVRAGRLEQEPSADQAVWVSREKSGGGRNVPASKHSCSGEGTLALRELLPASPGS